jgi:hypothetical protein
VVRLCSNGVIISRGWLAANNNAALQSSVGVVGFRGFQLCGQESLDGRVEAMRFKFIIILAALIIVSTPIAAQQGVNSIIGAGGVRCSVFTFHYKDVDMRMGFVNWSHGFMSGMNVMLAGKPETKHLQREIHDSNMMDYMRDYCSRYPSERYYIGVTEYFNTLPFAQLEK